MGDVVENWAPEPLGPSEPLGPADRLGVLITGFTVAVGIGKDVK